MSHNGRVAVLSIEVNITDIDATIDFVQKRVRSNSGGYVCVSNVHMCMETLDSNPFRHVVNSADLIIPDGRPIFWAQKLLGYSHAKQVRGQDITHFLCQLSNDSNITIGLYGGSSDSILNAVERNLLKQFPSIKIVYKYSPPFRPLTEEESNEISSTINQAGVDVLLVGIGCPKQEKWMAEHKTKINSLMLGVGAVFDFISGNKRHAPKWMQKLGLEWLFRLVSEPKRLWKRYLKQNPRFIWHIFCQVVFKKKYL